MEIPSISFGSPQLILLNDPDATLTCAHCLRPHRLCFLTALGVLGPGQKALETLA